MILMSLVETTWWSHILNVGGACGYQRSVYLACLILLVWVATLLTDIMLSFFYRTVTQLCTMPVLKAIHLPLKHC